MQKDIKDIKRQIIFEENVKRELESNKKKINYLEKKFNEIEYENFQKQINLLENKYKKKIKELEKNQTVSSIFKSLFTIIILFLIFFLTMDTISNNVSYLQIYNCRLFK